MLAIHLDGTFFGMRAATRVMAQRRSGAIVNVASICGMAGCESHPHYSAAKAGIIGLTRATAKELVEVGIRVNAVAPGFVDVDSPVNPVTETYRDAVSRNPLGRPGVPGEIAAAVLWLASDAAAFTTGAVLRVDGGATAGTTDLPLHHPSATPLQAGEVAS